jgi:hypothetical protein
MGRFSALFLLVIPFALAGCGENPRVDGTSTATVKSSMAKMTESMSDVDKKKFQAEAQSVALALSREAQPKGGEAPKTQEEVLKALNGMSVDDIHEKAESVKRAIKETRKKR